MRMLGIVLTIIVALCGAPALAADIEGSSDHPLVGRFQGSEIIAYKQSALDDVALLQAPHDYGALLDRNDLADRSGAEWLPIEGKVTRIRYELPAGHSSLEVIRAYQSALAAGGFSMVFGCEEAKCFTGTLADDYLLGQQIDTDNFDTTRYSTNMRYLLARLGGDDYSDPFASDAGFDTGVAPDDLSLDASGATDIGPGGPGSEWSGSSSFAAQVGPTYVSILVGEDQSLTTAFIEVVEPVSDGADASGNIEVIDADQMAAALDNDGSVNIYGLHFDYDSAVLQPDAGATLAQIAQLLAMQPQLRLAVVGHTDNQGSDSYNMQLSERRARSVVAALVEDYGIAPYRLLPSGQGPYQPVASNDSEDGRAQNRRVELIAQQ